MFNPGWLDTVVVLITGPSWCAGVVVDPQGTVATAYHCVANGAKPAVEFRDGRSLIGEVVARDPAHDLALVQVTTEQPLAFLRVRTDDIPVGSELWAIGHPFASAAGGKLTGVLRWSVSDGIVAAVGDWFIQTNAALNPGNSGGPLIDAEGRVVGIVSRKLSADNVSFATRAAHLLHLLASPTPGSLLGGTYGLNPGVIQAPDVTYLGANAWFSVRDRVVLNGWVGLEPRAQGQVAGAGTVSARQRFGRGSLTGTMDLGGGAWLPEGSLEPVIYARLGLGDVGFGAMLVPGTWAWNLSLDLGIPGEIGVF